MLLYDSRERAQSLVCFSRTGEGSGNIGLQHDNGASGRVTGGELIGRAALKIVLRKNLIGIRSIGGQSLTEGFLHKLFFPGVLPVAR